jgi:hypothetical protein
MSDTLPQNATPDDGLTPAQHLALGALLAGKTVTAAAQEAGVDRSTVYRWRQRFPGVCLHGPLPVHRPSRTRPGRPGHPPSPWSDTRSLPGSRRGPHRYGPGAAGPVPALAPVSGCQGRSGLNIKI